MKFFIIFQLFGNFRTQCGKLRIFPSLYGFWILILVHFWPSKTLHKIYNFWFQWNWFHVKCKWQEQCGNFMIFLSLRFCMKSILWILEVQKLPFLPFLGLRILLIWSFSAFKKCRNAWKSKFRASKCIKMANFALQNSKKLISRKIRVTEKSCNFHTVGKFLHLHTVNHFENEDNM